MSTAAPNGPSACPSMQCVKWMFLNDISAGKLASNNIIIVHGSFILNQKTSHLITDHISFKVGIHIPTTRSHSHGQFMKTQTM